MRDGFWGRRISGMLEAAKKPRIVMIGAGALLLVIMAANRAADKPGSASTPGAPQAVRVETAVAARADVPVYIEGLGTVQAFYTVTITPRVDGELISLGFVEGQTVRPGDMLAQIDPRPYQAAFDQALAAKFKDAAQLANARRDLERYLKLAPEEFTSQQVLETQRALVGQLEAQVVGDQAVIDNARTQLDYTTLRSPIQGRTGIRMTDPGNIVHAATSTGIVVVTQLQPISVIFTLPSDALPAISTAMASGPMTVSAVSRDGKTTLGTGVVGLIDNQIDQTTGTMRLKATFPNKDNRLWPGEFINARVLVQTRPAALTIPSAAVQRGPDGVFAYVVKPDSTVEMRPLQIGEDAEGTAIVEKGLKEGERVTTSNQYRLRPNVRVEIVAAASRATASPARAPAQ